MRVKIKDKIYDANEEALMLIFDDDEELSKVIDNLQNMGKTNGVRKYLTYPDTMGIEEVRSFMKIDIIK
jgi:hypothetical protein